MGESLVVISNGSKELVVGAPTGMKLDKLKLQKLALGITHKAEDVATAVCFLASDEANMITGTILPIDGGWTAK